MSILEFAGSLPDHRQEIKVRHLATDIIFITVAAVICGAEDWEDVRYFGLCKEWNSKLTLHKKLSTFFV